MEDSTRIALHHHLSKKARKSINFINNGWTMLLSEFCKEDLQLMETLGVTVFSSIGMFECASIPEKTLVIHLW